MRKEKLAYVFSNALHDESLERQAVYGVLFGVEELQIVVENEGMGLFCRQPNRHCRCPTSVSLEIKENTSQKFII